MPAAAADLSQPHVPTLFFAFRVMAGIGMLMLLALGRAWYRRTSLESGLRDRRTMLTLMACLPLPWMATLSGWMVAEVGRQPWVVHGQVLTAQVAAPLVSTSPALLAIRPLVYALLGAAFIHGCRLLWRHGPAPLAMWNRRWRQIRRRLPLWQPTRLAACTSTLD